MRRSLSSMRLKWRFGLAMIIAATVLGGFMAHGATSAAATAGAEMVQAVESPFLQPLTCTDATCGKGTPASSSPAPAVALAAVLAGIAVAAACYGAARRRRIAVSPLPLGTRDPLYHPPQAS